MGTSRALASRWFEPSAPVKAPESVGVVDVVVGVDELLLAGLALGVLAPRRVARRLAVGATWAAGSACVLSLTALLVAGGHYH